MILKSTADYHSKLANEYYNKLANGEAISEDEMVALLKEYDAARQGLLYLASCQAATLEGLPKSTSKGARERHVTLCKLAAQLAAGDVSGIRYSEWDEGRVRERCLNAVAEQAS